MLTLTIMDMRQFARAWHDADTHKAEDIEPTPYTRLLDEVTLALIRERE